VATLTTITSDHLNITRDLALQSPCVRRRYGCLITNGDKVIVTNNLRVSRCCNNQCVREVAGLKHGQRVDFGAEIHAEQAALIKWIYPVDKTTKMLIQAYNGKTDDRFYEENLYPCHVCALMIKYAGFKFVNITDRLDNLYSVSIDEIIEYRELALLDA
jgi:deoxycytidylate deaminase